MSASSTTSSWLPSSIALHLNTALADRNIEMGFLALFVSQVAPERGHRDRQHSDQDVKAASAHSPSERDRSSINAARNGKFNPLRSAAAPR